MRRGTRASPDLDERGLDLRELSAQLRKLMAFVKPYRRWLLASIVGVLFASGLGLVFPMIMGGLVDSAIGDGSSTSRLDRIAVLLLGVFVVPGQRAGSRRRGVFIDPACLAGLR